MSTNISKYCQLTDFILLEYEFNKSGEVIDLTEPKIATTKYNTKYFYEGVGSLGITNNALTMNSLPVDDELSTWFFDSLNPTVSYPNKDQWIDTENSTTSEYEYDTIKVHIVSGYNFDDISGFLLQIKALDNNGNFVELSNFTYTKQEDAIEHAIKFSPNTLFLGNRFYDKYIEFKIPSIQFLGGDNTTDIGSKLNVGNLSDVYVKYSTIFEIDNNDTYILDEIINVQLPVTSVADNFNCFIAESSAGDFIEFYALWGSDIIGKHISRIEGGNIKLYTSNNPNDNFEQFNSMYGEGSIKWVIMHEFAVYEHIPGGSSILTQKFAFTQDNGFSQPNYFRPILRNADILSSYSIQYTCRLMNRMDGTQIIRKAGFSSTDPTKYGLKFTRLNIDNILPYKVFNKIVQTSHTSANMPNIPVTKYEKVFYDITNIVLDSDGDLYPQGTGTLFIKSNTMRYVFKFSKLELNGNQSNIDLTGTQIYELRLSSKKGTTINIELDHSRILNIAEGELAFTIRAEHLQHLDFDDNNIFTIAVKNPNGSSYILYEGNFYTYKDRQKVLDDYERFYNINDLRIELTEKDAEIERLKNQIANKFREVASFDINNKPNK